MYTELEDADEYPIAELPDIPLWSENYCFDGYDAASDIGFWLHMGRPSQNPELLCELLYLYLPDDRFLVYKSYSRKTGQKTPGGAAMSFRCVVPFREWKLKYFGVARLVTRDQLMSGPLNDGPAVFVEFDIDWSAIAPVWNIGAKAQKQIWCTAHYEQSGLAVGQLRFSGRAIDIRCAAYRDHSRGPRDVSPMGRHAWIHGSFPDGRAFGMFEMRVHASNRNLSEGFVYANGRMYDARIDSVPLLTAIEDAYQPYLLSLTGDFGQWRLEGAPLHSVPQSLAPPNENMMGCGAQGSSHVVFQESTRFRLDHATGYGHTERSWRLVSPVCVAGSVLCDQ